MGPSDPRPQPGVCVVSISSQPSALTKLVHGVWRNASDRPPALRLHVKNHDCAGTGGQENSNI